VVPSLRTGRADFPDEIHEFRANDSWEAKQGSFFVHRSKVCRATDDVGAADHEAAVGTGPYCWNRGKCTPVHQRRRRMLDRADQIGPEGGPGVAARY